LFLLRELVLGSDVIGPDDDAFRRSIVCHDLGIEALWEGQPKCHQPDDPYDDSCVSSREPGPEGMYYCHVPTRRIGNALVNCTTNIASVKTHQGGIVGFGFIYRGILIGSRL